MLIDTHCHIDQYKEPLLVAENCEREKVFVLAVTNLPSMFEDAYHFLKDFKYVKPALGFHPLLARDYRHELKKFEILLDRADYIGEIGLDYSKAGKHFQKAQIDILKFIFGCLKAKNKFISLHSREAEAPLLDLVEEFQIESAVLHWYSGSLKNLDRALSIGCFLSVNPAMINSANGQRIISRIPENRILTETDGPYVKVNRRIAMPQSVVLTHKYLSKLWNKAENDVNKQLRANFGNICRKLKKEMTNVEYS